MKYVLMIIKAVDEEAIVTIMKGLRTQSYKIVLSNVEFKKKMVEDIAIAHEVLNIPIEFSRTLALSKSVYFEMS